MVEYDDIDKLSSPEGVAGSSSKCTVRSASGLLKEAFKNFDNYSGFGEIVGKLNKIADEFRSPFSIFDSLNTKKVFQIEKDIEDISRKLNNKNISDADWQKLSKELRKKEEEKLSLPNFRAKSLAHDAENSVNFKISTYAKKDLQDLVKNYKLEKEDIDIFNRALGSETEGLEIPKILGDDGDDIIAQFKKQGEKINTGSVAMDKYLAKTGIQGAKNVYHMAKSFRSLADAAGLPKDRRLSYYLSNLDLSAKEANMEMLNTLYKTFPGLKEHSVKIKQFFEYPRIKDFESFSSDPLELLNIYYKATIKKISNKEIQGMINLRFSTPESKFGSAAEYKRFTEAMDTMITNLTDIRPDPDFTKYMGNVTKGLYAFSLSNNVGSAINNLTSITNLVMSKYGVSNTMRAVAELTKKESKIVRLLESYGIGSPEDGMSVLEINLMGTKTDDMLKKANLFNASEQKSIMIASLAKLAKHYGNMDNVVRRIDDIMKLSSFKKQAALNRLIQTAKEGAMETIFNNIRGNTSKLAKEYKGPMGIMTMFLKHQTREANFIWKEIKRGMTSGADKAEAAKVLGRYFFAKTMLMGREAAFLFVPKGLQDQIDSHLPELRKAQEGLGQTLDAIALPKLALNQVGIDFTMHQDIMWPVEIPFMILSDPKAVGTKIPALGILGQTASAIQNTINGKADAHDAVRLAAAMSFIPAAHRGVFIINNVPIGGQQLKKVGDMAVDLAMGKNSFWGQEKPLEGFNDYKELIVGAVAPSTPSKSAIIKSKEVHTKGSYKNYLIALSFNGGTDKEAFSRYAKDLGKTPEETKKHLIQSMKATFKDLENDPHYSKGEKTLNGY